MKKKGFTLIELLAVIIILGMVIALAVGGYNGFLVKGKNKAYKIEEKSFKTAATDSLVDCMSNGSKKAFCNSHNFPEEQYQYQFIYLDELIEAGYIDPIHNPDNTDELCSTDSYVYVTNKADTKKVNNSDLEYKVCLVCGKYKSEDCLDDVRNKVSDFDAICKITTDPLGQNLYNNEWTDQDLYLNISIDEQKGGYQYGISYFVYILDNLEKNVSSSNNKATVKLTDTILNKAISVKARDGKGDFSNTIACTGSNGSLIKLDKSRINSAKIIGKVVGGIEIESYSEATNTWASNDVLLTVVTNPKTIPSGYLYQWYKDGVMIKDWSSESTYTATGDGEYYAIVSNPMKLQQITTKKFVVKIDRTVPTISVKTNPLSLTTQDYNFISNVNYSFGISGGTVTCNPPSTKKSGSYTVTCTASGNNRITKAVMFTVNHSYTATVTQATPIPHVHRDVYGNVRDAGYGASVPGGCFTKDGYVGMESTLEFAHEDSGGMDFDCKGCDLGGEHDGSPYDLTGDYCYCYVKAYVLNCNKTIDGYSCPIGQTTAGDKCYACPNGGNLLGTICYY